MISAGELLARKITEYPMLVEGMLPKVGVATLGGGSDTGKSSLLRDLALHIVEGKDHFLGQKINKTNNRAILVSTEDDEDSVAYLLYKQLADADPQNYEGLLFEFETVNLLEKLDEAIQENPTPLVIVDAYTDVFTGDINNSVSVRNFLNKYRELANKHQCLILFLHHFGKGRSEEIGSKHSLLGSQGYEAKMRVVLTLVKDPNDKNVRRLQIVKGNYLTDEDKNSFFKLKFQDNMRFECIGRSEERTPSKSEKEGEKKAALSMMPKLLDEGRNWDEITEIINGRGLNYSRSTLNNWYNDSKE